MELEWMFSTDFMKIPISNCMTISPEGAELLMLTDGHDDLIVDFHNFQTRLKTLPSRYTIRWWPAVKWGYRCPHHTLLSSKNKLGADRSTCTFLFLVLAWTLKLWISQPLWTSVFLFPMLYGDKINYGMFQHICWTLLWRTELWGILSIPVLLFLHFDSMLVGRALSL
jgi:hypothetical protein